MNLDKSRFIELIKSFKFKELFNELGWDNASKELQVNINDDTFKLTAVAEKRGFLIFVCSPNSNGKIPTKDIRKKIDTKITKIFFEHLIIYTDKNNTHQIWQLVIRDQDKPIVIRETDYFSPQHPELLFQRLRGIFISLDDEDKVTLADVRSNVREQFNTNAERVTKRFYDEFNKHHTSFLKFIKGIEDNVSKEWYASLMLNRLMFIYFIQKKGFLDNNPNYLHDKLKAIQQKKGKDKFYSFYRNFLLVLFHKGLSSPESERNDDLKKEIGKVPYLNGGLFDVHQIEKENQNIEIPDEAFEKIFNFFDKYNWHLDNRITATGRDINPDVIGYIFEKYINDRAEMGAYYTKEDITEYISKNTIIPFLFDRVKESVSDAFRDDSSLWKMLRENPDRYIYDAVKFGVNLIEEEFNTDKNLDDPTHPLWKDLPDEIRQGFRLDIKDKIVVADERPHLWEIRKPWTKPAPSDIALPTEIYREVIERRKRYFEIRKKIVNGEIKEINDFITYNLNIRQFAQDAIERYEDYDFINAFYIAIAGRKANDKNSRLKEKLGITILDPTCGSGAFLFAALNILEPLYYACIERMKGFVESDTTGKKFTQFRKVLEEITKHPSQQYFIYKSIILNNLYGVDIMKEAVEIAKLRLFLKLVAEVDEFDHLEPLPDIDFNIRAGNTLVGFISYEEIKNIYEEAEVTGKFMFEEETKLLNKIKDQSLIVSKLFREFKEKQTIIDAKCSAIRETKDEVQKRLNELNDLLNKYKAYESGIYSDNLMQQKKYKDWIISHKPFHWFAEFYEIMEVNGGFDVIIGNPPYLAIGNINYKLKTDNFRCSDIYGYIIRRNFQILNSKAHYGFIIMHNLAFSKNFSDVRNEIKANSTNAWFSFYARIPAGLFSGDVRVRNCIFILKRGKNLQFKNYFTTRIHRWFAEEREFLFKKINYAKFNFNDVIPMFNSDLLSRFFESLEGKPIAFYTTKSSPYKLYFKQNAYNWIAVSTNPAPCYNKKREKIEQSQVSELAFNVLEYQKFCLLLLNGKLFFSKWLSFGDEFHLTKEDIVFFRVPFEKLSVEDNGKLNKLSSEFEEKLPDTIKFKLNAGKKVGTYNTSKLWYITDISDSIFLKYLCENPEEVFNELEKHIYQTIKTSNEEFE